MYAKAPHPKKALKAETLCGASTFFSNKKTTLEHDSVKPLIKIIRKCYTCLYSYIY